MPSSPPVAVVAGASGFLGRAVRAALIEDGHRILTVSRSGGDATWADDDGLVRAPDGANLLVNLAGKSVGCRYTDANRDEILRSRIATTSALRTAVARAAEPPPLWLNASTATIYRHAMDRPQGDDDGELGSGFSVDVARTWEATFFAGDLPGTRRVALRMAIVLGDGPAQRQLLTAARFGLGGPQPDGWWFDHRRYRGIGPEPTGDGRPPRHRTQGRQKFSWVHVDDVVGVVRFVRDQSEITGPLNVAVPRPSDNRTLMAALRRRVGAPFGLPAPRWLLEIGMWALRNEPELLLKSRWVAPRRLRDAGFEFAVTDLDEAFAR